MEITAITAISMSYSQVAPIQSFFHHILDNDEYGDDIEYEQSGDELEMGMEIEDEDEDESNNNNNSNDDNTFGINHTGTTVNGRAVATTTATASTPMVFIAYSDGSIQIIDLNSLTEICLYSHLDRDPPVLFPKDKTQRGMSTSRGSDVRVRSLMVTRVGMVNELGMQECVMIVGLG